MIVEILLSNAKEFKNYKTVEGFIIINIIDNRLTLEIKDNFEKFYNKIIKNWNKLEKIKEIKILEL